MNAHALVTRVQEAVGKVLSSQNLDQLGRARAATPLLELMREALQSPPSLTQEQTDLLRSLAVKLLVSEEPSACNTVSIILANCGALGYAGDIEAGIEVVIDGQAVPPVGPLMKLSILEQAGVFEPGEVSLYFDKGAMCIKSKTSGRHGTLFLTNRRVISVGPYLTKLEKTRRQFYYEDWSERPYVTSLDYVYIDQLKGLEKKKHEIKAKYRTKYWEEKQRTFYGPYFLRSDLPSKVSAKEGDVEVYFVPKQYKEPQEFPRGHQGSRTGLLFDRIQQIWPGKV